MFHTKYYPGLQKTLLNRSNFEQGSNYMYQPTTMDINKRLYVQSDITKALQMQFNEVEKVMNQFVEKGKNMQPAERNQIKITVSPVTQTYRYNLETSESVLQPKSENAC